MADTQPSLDPAKLLLELAELPPELGMVDLLGARGGDLPVELEVGCGKGRFLIAAAKRWPRHAFLAIEHSRALARKVARRCAREGHANVRLLVGDARDLVPRLSPSSLARAHVYCPDPWPKRRHAKHRLFRPPFPTDLARALVPGGELLFTSDHDPYFREVTARLAADPHWVRCTADEVFADLPRGGFDAIFEEGAVPVFRGVWQRRVGTEELATGP